MKINYSCVFAASIILIFTGACRNKGGKTTENANYKVVANDTIELSEESNLIGKLESETVTLSSYAASIKTTGVISPCFKPCCIPSN